MKKKNIVRGSRNPNHHEVKDVFLMNMEEYDMEEYVQYLWWMGHIDRKTTERAVKFLKVLPEEIKKSYNRPPGVLNWDDSDGNIYICI